MQSIEAIRKQEFSETLSRASVRDLGVILMGSGYEVQPLYFLFLPFDQSILVFPVAQLICISVKIVAPMSIYYDRRKSSLFYSISETPWMLI